MSKVACLQCTHALTAHTRDDQVGACRVTGCGCMAFVEPPIETPPGAPRRVCIDVPDGYVLSVSLIPAGAVPEQEET